MIDDIEPLIHVGYHKTGTTWLQVRIFSDASRGFTPVSPQDVIEQAFVGVNPFTFDASTAAGLLRPFVRDAQGKGTTLVVSHERLSGQPLHGGVDARAIADRLYETMPNGRVLVVLRDQPDMLVSIYKQITTRGLNRDTFAQFLHHRVSASRTSPVLEFFEYHHLIRYYQSLFGEDRVLVLPYELMNDPLDLVGRIAKFIGAPMPAHVPMGGENVGLPASAIAAIRWVNLAFRTLGMERWLTGPQARPKAVNARLSVMRQLGKPKLTRISRRIDRRWREGAVEFLGERFAESNRETQELAGLDLASLGYVVAG